MVSGAKRKAKGRATSSHCVVCVREREREALTFLLSLCVGSCLYEFTTASQDVHTTITTVEYHILSPLHRSPFCCNRYQPPLCSYGIAWGICCPPKGGMFLTVFAEGLKNTTGTINTTLVGSRAP